MVSEIRAVTNRLVFYTVRVQGPLGLRSLFVRKGKGPSFVVYNFGGTIKGVDADDTSEVTSITVIVTEANKAARPYANPLLQEKVFQVGQNTKVELDEQDADRSALQAGQVVEVQFKGAASADPTSSAATAISAKSAEEETEPTG
jgi:hypothetical protein